MAAIHLKFRLSRMYYEKTIFIIRSSEPVSWRAISPGLQLIPMALYSLVSLDTLRKTSRGKVPFTVCLLGFFIGDRRLHVTVYDQYV